MSKASKAKAQRAARQRARDHERNHERQPNHEQQAQESTRAIARAMVDADPARRLPFAPTWPEIAEVEHKLLPSDMAPPLAWRVLEREAATTRQYYIEHPAQWAKQFGTDHYRAFGTAAAVRDATPEQFDLRNIQHFQALPSVQTYKKQCMMNAAMHYGILKRQPQAVVDQVAAQVQAEQAHLLYHQAMWRAHGRRVYVLDRMTYELLAATPLPKLPASILSMPFHAFYLKLPERVFQFEVRDTRTGQHDISWVEGICVAMDKIEPEYQGTRELAFTVMGEYDTTPNVFGDSTPLRSEGRNTAFISIRIGPDALLSEIKFAGGVRAITRGVLTPGGDVASLAYGAADHVGSHELGETVPRVVLGLLLYLASEHPDVVPVHPAPRRDVDSIRNPAKRRKAEQQNDRTTRLTMLYVGRHLAEEVNAETDSARMQYVRLTGRTLDHPVWVRGHWRLQPVGVGRALRKTIWIRPYVKGPDVADALTIRAAKIQRAEHAGEHAGEHV